MADMKKVLNGLECCADRTDRKCQICPYDSPDNIYCVSDITRDALELLKEQEPVHAQKREFAHMWFWCCGSCGVAITEGDKFCRNCGKAVKWDDT